MEPNYSDLPDFYTKGAPTKEGYFFVLQGPLPEVDKYFLQYSWVYLYRVSVDKKDSRVFLWEANGGSYPTDQRVVFNRGSVLAHCPATAENLAKILNHHQELRSSPK